MHRQQKITELIISPFRGLADGFVPFLASAIAALPVLTAMIKETSAASANPPFNITDIYHIEIFFNWSKTVKKTLPAGIEPATLRLTALRSTD